MSSHPMLYGKKGSSQNQYIHICLTSVVFYPTLCHQARLNLILCYTFDEVIGMKPLKEKISITVDSDVLTKNKQLAEADDRSLSQYINMVLKKHLENQDTK